MKTANNVSGPQVSLVSPVCFPDPTGISVNMLPFVMGDDESLPAQLRHYKTMIDACGLEPEQFGKVGYLSVMENFVPVGESQRRPGIHTDKHSDKSWGGGWGRGSLTNQRRDGIYLASTVEHSCRAWDLSIEAPGKMGDCEHLRPKLENIQPVIMQRNTLYWITDSCPHESLPVEFSTFRQWFRLVTHKIDVWYEQHSTRNPSVEPQATILKGNKFV